MPNPIKRHSKSRRNMRRAHDALKPAAPTACPQCRAPKLPHHVCPNCGTYKGREIVPIEKGS
ncbi:MAG: 50S ribosomal protein L32 [Thermodesulfobacteriota bacterium]